MPIAPAGTCIRLSFVPIPERKIEMIKINSVGNKLGLAGLLGILLSVGVVGNGIRTESTIAELNRDAATQQKIADSAYVMQATLRSMQLASNALRMAITTPGIEGASADLQAAKTALDEIESSVGSLAIKDEVKKRFGEIKVQTGDYVAAAGEMVTLQKKLLDLYRTRNVAALDWSRHLEQMRATTAITEAQNWAEVNMQLADADSAVNAVQAAAWRYAAMNELLQKAQIGVRAKVLNTALSRASVIDDNELLQAGLVQLSTDMKKFMAATDEAIKINDLKTSVTLNKILPAASSASELATMAVASAQGEVIAARNRAAEALVLSGKVSGGLSIVLVLVLVATVAFSFLGVARPMKLLNRAMARMAKGDLGVVIPGAKRGDEIGDIAKTVTVIRENAELKARDEAETRIDLDKAAAVARKREMVQLADSFEQAVGNIVETVSAASSQLEASAGSLTATAERSQELTIVVAAASEEASANVQSVASATEQMASSVNEIGRQVQESATIAHSAVAQASHTNERVAALALAASRIGDVVELINTIAGQTNLLALNATIEAARAGDAGRGFAVVASEVKALAEQTAKATGEISQQINGIQAATRESVGAIKEIGTTIGRMSEIASTIASAVEQQGAATQEISRNVQQAAQGTLQVSVNITDVQRGASETGTASSHVLSAAQSLSLDSNRLKAEVGKFLDSVRAA
jgi:methyl-accepting chemotaxis protein